MSLLLFFFYMTTPSSSAFYSITHLFSLFQKQDPVIDGVFVDAQFVDLSMNSTNPISRFGKPLMFGTVGDEGEGFVEIVLEQLLNYGQDKLLSHQTYEAIIKIVWGGTDKVPEIINDNEKERQEAEQMLLKYPFSFDCDRFNSDRNRNDSLCDGRDALNHWVRDVLFTCADRAIVNNLRKNNQDSNLFFWFFDEVFPWVPPELNEQFVNGYRRCDIMACHGADIQVVESKNIRK